MKRLKKIAWALFVLLLLLQFIRPEKNLSNEIFDADITNVYPVPQDVQSILKKACYDCHSNNTQYPWYAEVQPFGLFLNRHIKEGKKELNFNEFVSYSLKKQKSKLKATAEQTKDGEMPLKSYTLLHPEARLSKVEKEAIIQWIKTTVEKIQSVNK